jgi:hypothetical protein
MTRAGRWVIDPVLVYSSFLGGSSIDDGIGIAVDSDGHAYVSGRTESTDFPITPGAFQTANAGGSDAFVTKLSHLGNALIYSTYLGGSDFDQSDDEGIALDREGHAYVSGFTASTDSDHAGRLPDRERRRP